MKKYQNSKFCKTEFWFDDFSTVEFWKKFWPEYPESETESKFCFQWGSQKLEPKIGIPNLACRELPVWRFAFSCSITTKYFSAGKWGFSLGPAHQLKVGVVERHGQPTACSCLTSIDGNFSLGDIQNPMQLLIIIQLPIAPNLCKVKFYQKCPESFKPREKICIGCPLYLSLLDCRQYVCIQWDICHPHQLVI